MIKKLTLSALTALAITASGAIASGGGGHVENVKFPFDGPFGKWDQAQLQRGLQVYTEVCSACHGLQYVPLRTLGDLGYTDAEVRAYAAELKSLMQSWMIFARACPQIISKLVDWLKLRICQ